MPKAVLNIPTGLTWARVALIPLFWLCFAVPFVGHIECALGVFILAGLTDWLDGFLARRLEQKTQFGAFLDPVADKLMVAMALVLVVGEKHSVWVTWPATVIVGREIMVSALREWMAEWGAREQIAVSRLGQWKTAFQLFSVSALLYGLTTHVFAPWVSFMGVLMLWFSALLTWGSMFQYLRMSWSRLK